MYRWKLKVETTAGQTHTFSVCVCLLCLRTGLWFREILVVQPASCVQVVMLCFFILLNREAHQRDHHHHHHLQWSLSLSSALSLDSSCTGRRKVRDQHRSFVQYYSGVLILDFLINARSDQTSWNNLQFLTHQHLFQELQGSHKVF